MSRAADAVAIQPLRPGRVPDLDRIDGRFLVDSELILSAAAGAIRYEVRPVPAYEKSYGDGPAAAAGYLDAPDRAGFVAVIGDEPAGYLLVAEAWNRFARVDDLAVDRAHRRRGVAAALLGRAADWARGRGLAGLSLETQSNNIGACRLYERLGFVLAGFDVALYSGLSPAAREIALFWYLAFGAEAAPVHHDDPPPPPKPPPDRPPPPKPPDDHE